jgi:hypothetical protein
MTQITEPTATTTEPESQAGRDLLISDFVHYNECSGIPQYCNCGDDLKEELRTAVLAIEAEMRAKPAEVIAS